MILCIGMKFGLIRFETKNYANQMQFLKWVGMNWKTIKIRTITLKCIQTQNIHCFQKHYFYINQNRTLQYQTRYWLWEKSWLYSQYLLWILLIWFSARVLLFWKKIIKLNCYFYESLVIQSQFRHLTVVQ